MKRLFSPKIVVHFITALLFLSACQLLTPTPVPVQESFDTDPQTVVLSLDIRYPGIPLPTVANGTQQCFPYPVIRLWGDNYALLNTGGPIIQRERISSGFINAATRASLYNVLINEQFFVIPTISAPNPAGTAMMMEAKLKNRPVFDRSGEIGFINYQALIDLVNPAVIPVSEQVTPDARIEAFFKEFSDCPRY